MKKIFFLVVFFTFSGLWADDSCDCPKLGCNSCQIEEGVTFYTEKCAGGAKVKSCARPTCVALEPAPVGCEQAKNAEPQVVKGLAPVAAREVLDAKNSELASRGEPAGKVGGVLGKVTVQMERGAPLKPLKEEDLVFAGDWVETGADGKVNIQFSNGNEMTLVENSKIKIAEFTAQNEVKRVDNKTLIDLLKGKVRSKVKEKYKNTESNFFKVRTHTAVAGVRGTDFVLSYDSVAPGADHVEARVETLRGEVELASPDRDQRLLVPTGKYASYVVAADQSTFSDSDISGFVSRGYMTPVYDLKEADRNRIDMATSLKTSARNVASDEVLCREPSGRLNQCYWRCQNNPKGESRCRADVEGVSCLRKRCNANGVWAEESRLPASTKNHCQPEKDVVAPCDY